MPVLLAILSATFYGSADASYRVALQRLSLLNLAVVFGLIQLCVAALIVLIIPPKSPFDPLAAVWFGLGGFFNPALFAFFFFQSVRVIGSARSSAIKGTAPVFAVLAAVVVLGERPLWPQYVGVISIGMGILCLHMEGVRGDWPRRAIVFPLAAALCTGTATVFFKLGLLRMPEPFLGLVLAQGVSTTVFATAWTLQGRVGTKGGRPAFFRAPSPAERIYALLFALPSGVLSIGGTTFMFLALQSGDVSTVVPLVQCAPIATLFWSALLLRTLERPTWNLAFAVALVLLGGYLVSAFRPLQ